MRREESYAIIIDGDYSKDFPFAIVRLWRKSSNYVYIFYVVQIHIQFYDDDLPFLFAIKKTSYHEEEVEKAYIHTMNRASATLKAHRRSVSVVATVGRPKTLFHTRQIQLGLCVLFCVFSHA